VNIDNDITLLSRSVTMGNYPMFLAMVVRLEAKLSFGIDGNDFRLKVVIHHGCFKNPHGLQKTSWSTSI